MPYDWEESDDVIAAGAICPVPDCGALAVAYRSTEGVGHDDAGPWEFTCPRCGIEFAIPHYDLIFQSVPKDWLLAKVHVAQPTCHGTRQKRGGTPMPQDDRDILHLLKVELAFLENGGYKASARASWKPTTLLLDSPICPNFNRSDPGYSCQDCQLIQFVPPERKKEDCPCHHIPLNTFGETLDSLYRWGTEEEREQALRNWLHETIGRIERERFYKKCA